MQIYICHIGYKDNTPEFVVRLDDGTSTLPILLVPPEQVSVEGRPQSHLAQDLRWYLENFLQLPVGGNLSVADQVCAALDNWGETCFNALFRGQAKDWFLEARRAGLELLDVEVHSNDPRVLSWPWEALLSAEDRWLALRCHLTRHLSQLGDPLPLPRLPDDCLRVLWIIARPFGDKDVDFQALSRPVIDLKKAWQGRLEVDVLRPPTLARLREVLEQRPGHYHMVHFDGHGAYAADAAEDVSYIYKGKSRGVLLFENEEGCPFKVDAETLSQLLAEYRIPLMVLTACQSAQLDSNAKDVYSSIAAAMLWSGIRHVVAMSYALHVSGAKLFVPAFYRKLLDCGHVGEAVREGRKAMYAKPQRDCPLGQYPLRDWIVPVLYQRARDEKLFSMRRDTASADEIAPSTVALPDIVEGEEPYGFVGRGQALHDLERAHLWQKQAAILIHGMAGAGKTTLVKEFLRWLRDTCGMRDSGKNTPAPLWFDFRELRSVDVLLDDLVATWLGCSSQLNSRAEKITALCRILREKPGLIIWDNFESASGFLPGTEGQLPTEDRELLRDLLERLRGGRTRIFITSRSPEDWLPVQACFRLFLHGLQGEDLLAYCNTVVRDLALHINQADKTVQKLISRLAGNPLALRALLLRLNDSTAEALLDELNEQFIGHKGDESTRRLLAVLAVFDKGLPATLGPLLEYVGLHEQNVDGNLLELMLIVSGDASPRLEKPLLPLEAAGLLFRKRKFLYDMHPMLRVYLRQRYPASCERIHAFVIVMTNLALEMAPKLLCEQRSCFNAHEANFHEALKLASLHALFTEYQVLLSAQALYALHRWRYSESEQLYIQLLKVSQELNEIEGERVACHQLGLLAERREDFEKSEYYILRALGTNNLNGDSSQMDACHQLDILFQKQSKFEKAEIWRQRALGIAKQLKDKRALARIYHEMGMQAQVQRQMQKAEHCYQQALDIEQDIGDQMGMLITKHQLGRLADDQDDLVKAWQGYLQSLDIGLELEDYPSMARNSHMLGMVAKKRGDTKTALHRFLSACQFGKQANDIKNLALTYEQLGMLTHEEENFASAKEWYLLSLGLDRQLGNKQEEATILWRLAVLHWHTNELDKAACCCLDGLQCCFSGRVDDRLEYIILSATIGLLRNAPNAIAADLRRQWKERGLEERYNDLEEVERCMEEA